MKRFVKVDEPRFTDHLDLIGAAVKNAGGEANWLTVGHERVFEIRPPHQQVWVRTFTTMAHGRVRDCGKDAVRVTLITKSASGTKGISKGRRLLRTAPKDADDRQGIFLRRVTDAIREAYRAARDHPTCSECGSAMVTRTSKHGRFLGCSDYPTCKNTKR